jgi:hypothetical protein
MLQISHASPKSRSQSSNLTLGAGNGGSLIGTQRDLKQIGEGTDMGSGSKK